MSKFKCVFRGPSTIVLPIGESVTINKYPTPSGSVEVIVRTRYEAGKTKDPIPRELWIEVSGDSSDIDRAMRDFSKAAFMIPPFISTMANGMVADVEIEIAFGCDEKDDKHDYFQHILPSQDGIPLHVRRVKKEDVVKFIDAWNSWKGIEENDQPRLYRAMVNYHLALQNWKKGRETFVAMFLYIAAENLTKILLRRECIIRGLSEDDLWKDWGLTKKQELDSEVKRRLIFLSDNDTYSSLKKASDKYEHGTTGLDEIYEWALQSKEKAANYIRRCVLELLPISTEFRDYLNNVETGYGIMVGTGSFQFQLRGILNGKAENLAGALEYPYIEIQSLGVTEYKILPDGKAELTPSMNQKYLIGENTTMDSVSISVWSERK
jgi:hypothetical protein